MANENKITIIDALKQLRKDLQKWVANNLNNIKSELSESIVSESKEFTVVDEEGNAVAKIDESGLAVTAVNTKNVSINGTDVQQELDKKASLYIGSGEMPEGYDIQIDPDSEALIVPIESGGTGATTAAAARENLGVAPAPVISQTDITAGTTELTSGTVYLVYE
jgi:hypothetical protein